MKISICKDTNQNALSKWEEIEVKKYTQLASYIKQYPYSAAVFKDGYRNGENVVGFQAVIIFDIDNDKDTSQLKIKEAEQLLKQHNISSMIITSKSHNIDKNGHISQRYRIIIPTNKGIDNVDKETYKEFQNLTAKALKLDEYVDKKALNDKARFYYKSPATAEIIIIKSDRVINIDNLQKKAKENVLNKQKIKEEEQQKNKEIKENIQVYKTMQKEVNNNNLTYANVDKIMQLDIKQLINHFEKQSEQYKEGSYYMIKTDIAKYSILDLDNIAHDFRSDITYNSLTYLQSKLNTNNLNKIAKELEKISGENYIEINYTKVKEVVKEAIKIATNDKSLENIIKEKFNVKFVKFGDNLIIADKEIKLSDIDTNKQEIIRALQKNRQEQH